MQFLPLNRYQLDNPTPFKRSYIRKFLDEANRPPAIQNEQASGDTFTRRQEPLPNVFELLGQDDEFERSQSPRQLIPAFDDDEPLLSSLSTLSPSSPVKEQFSELSGPITVEFPGIEPFVLPGLDLRRQPEIQDHNFHQLGLGLMAVLEQEFPRWNNRQEPEKSFQSQDKPEAERPELNKPVTTLSKRRAELAIKRKALLQDYTLGETNPKKLAEIHEVTPRHARDWIQKFRQDHDSDLLLRDSTPRSERKKRASKKRQAAEEDEAIPAKRPAHETNRQTKTTLIAFNPETNALEIERPISRGFHKPIVQTGDAESLIPHFMPGLPNT